MEPSSTTTPSSTPIASVNPNTKIMKDLGVLKEKMDLCESMLHPGAGSPKLSVHTSDAMLAVIGFLEACAPRMIELVEAASMTGVLTETVFEETLQCNDRLLKLLSDIETAALTETPAETTVAAAAPASATADDLTDQFNDLLLGNEESDPAPALKTTGETSEDVKQPASVPASTSNDEFDAFFAARQGS
jgi:hypothetical protein